MPTKTFKSIIGATVLTLASFAPLGCEERVVGIQNSWGGSTIDRLNREKEQKQSEKHLENLGNFLFGWVDDISGKPKPTQPREYIPR